jgi:uncharacterized protein
MDTTTFLQYLWLLPLGVMVGAFGTLIGAGGGFILMPVLIILYPHEQTRIITSISLAVVFFNALSGTIAYSRMKRIDYKSGTIFLIATIPGAILGAISTNYVDRQIFDTIFGTILLASSIFLILTGGKKGIAGKCSPVSSLMKISLTDSEGTRHQYSYNPYLGIFISIIVGFLSSFLGIGGGVIHVPALSCVLNFPVHIATATSHFILTGTSLTGTIVHIVTGAFTKGVRRTIFLSVGVAVGAQFGALLSTRFKGTAIIQSLGVALLLLGIRILWFNFTR